MVKPSSNINAHATGVRVRQNANKLQPLKMSAPQQRLPSHQSHQETSNQKAKMGESPSNEDSSANSSSPPQSIPFADPRSASRNSGNRNRRSLQSHYAFATPVSGGGVEVQRRTGHQNLLQKYSAMFTSGISLQAVKAEMKQDGADPSLIQLVELAWLASSSI